MALPDILRNIGTALDRIEGYINGNTSFDSRNTLNNNYPRAYAKTCSKCY
jgi:hypothetical protein